MSHNFGPVIPSRFPLDNRSWQRPACCPPRLACPEHRRHHAREVVRCRRDCDLPPVRVVAPHAPERLADARRAPHALPGGLNDEVARSSAVPLSLAGSGLDARAPRPAPRARCGRSAPRGALLSRQGVVPKQDPTLWALSNRAMRCAPVSARTAVAVHRHPARGRRRSRGLPISG